MEAVTPAVTWRRKWPVDGIVLAVLVVLAVANGLLWAFTIPFNEGPDEAAHFSSNAIVLDRDIVLPEGAPRLVTTLEQRGYRCHCLAMSEFLKAGGACKCLTLLLPQRP